MVFSKTCIQRTSRGLCRGLCQKVLQKQVEKDLHPSQNVEYIEDKELKKSYKAAQGEMNKAMRESPSDQNIKSALICMLQIHKKIQGELVYWLKKLKTNRARRKDRVIKCISRCNATFTAN
jgi:uncharacterized membrane protein YheB (UPF0754 family)